mmetsp:Transcript_15942/g.34440  ORF Transcript_15942/g.34440 Transcript_15942/m.34440 type:complete len:225 (-) Transcript_15942:524-1198(-)
MSFSLATHAFSADFTLSSSFETLACAAATAASRFLMSASCTSAADILEATSPWRASTEAFAAASCSCCLLSSDCSSSSCLRSELSLRCSALKAFCSSLNALVSAFTSACCFCSLTSRSDIFASRSSTSITRFSRDTSSSDAPVSRRCSSASRALSDTSKSSSSSFFLVFAPPFLSVSSIRLSIREISFLTSFSRRFTSISLMPNLRCFSLKASWASASCFCCSC